MKNIIFLILLLFVGLNVKAQTEAAVSEPGACVNCSSKVGLANLEQDVESLKRLSSGTADFSKACAEPNDPNCKILKFSKEKYVEYGKNCANFFNDKDGKLGKLSVLLTKQISASILKDNENSPFMKSYPDLISADMCPGYTTMKPTSKVAFWTWFFEIMAFFETSCNPNAKNSANDVPNGPAVGLYQLEYQKSLRKWRGPNCAVDEKTILTAEGNTACAVDEMQRLLKKNGTIFGQRDPKTGKLTAPNYWHALNQLPTKLVGNKNEVHNRFARYLPRFPLCKK